MSSSYSAMAREFFYDKTISIKSPILRSFINQPNGELLALHYLSLNGEQSLPKKLSEGMSVSSARMASLLKHMEYKGWISRTSDPDNKRQTIVRLLPAGKKHLQESEEKIISYIALILEALGPEDAVLFVKLQKRLMEIIPSIQRR